MSEAPPFEVAARQAMQSAVTTAVVTVRFTVAVAGIVRRHQEREATRIDPARAEQIQRLRHLHLDPAQAPDRYAQMVRETFTSEDLRTALLSSPEWPQLAAELHAMETAGVDVRAFLGETAQSAERVLRALAPPPPTEAAAFYAKMVRDHVPDLRIRQALLEAPEWPELAEQLRQMQAVGVDIPQLLAQTSTTGVSLHDTLARSWREAAHRAAGLEAETAPARRAETAAVVNGPASGTAVAANLADRKSALDSVGISPQENSRFVRIIRDNVPDAHHAGVLVVSRQWPGIAAQMRDLEAKGIDPGPRLANLGQELAKLAANGGRPDLATAAVNALGTPPPAVRTVVATAATAGIAPTLTTEQLASLRWAAETAVSCLGLSADQLISKHGLPKDEAARILSELQGRGIIGPLTETGVHRCLVSTSAEAAARLGPPPGTSAPAHDVVYRWQITFPEENRLEVVREGEVRVPAGFREGAEVQRFGMQQLRQCVNPSQSSAYNAHYKFSAVGPDGHEVRANGGEVTAQVAAAANGASSTPHTGPHRDGPRPTVATDSTPSPSRTAALRGGRTHD